MFKAKLILFLILLFVFGPVGCDADPPRDTSNPFPNEPVTPPGCADVKCERLKPAPRPAYVQPNTSEKGATNNEQN